MSFKSSADMCAVLSLGDRMPTLYFLRVKFVYHMKLADTESSGVRGSKL